MNKSMYQSLLKIKNKYEDLEKELMLPEVLKDISLFTKKSREKKAIHKIIETFNMFLQNEQTIKDATLIIQNETDKEIVEMGRLELDGAQKDNEALEEKLKILLLPKDPNDFKNVLVEIRGAAGGEEANLFAANLFDIYKRWASLNNYKIIILNSHITDSGGFSEICFKIKGENIYSKMKFETGVHRVQRIPKTETQGRVHTSTVTVVIMPEPDENDEIKISNADLVVDTFRASGAGGQHINTTDSAIRITHVPSGIIVQSQDGRSQIKNREIAIQILRTKLFELEIKKQQEIESTYRKKSGTGARSEKIRTYNYPQDRVTDHRTKTSFSLKTVLEGKIDPIFQGLIAEEQAFLISNSQKAN